MSFKNVNNLRNVDKKYIFFKEKGYFISTEYYKKNIYKNVNRF